MSLKYLPCSDGITPIASSRARVEAMEWAVEQIPQMPEKSCTRMLSHPAINLLYSVYSVEVFLVIYINPTWYILGSVWSSGIGMTQKRSCILDLLYNFKNNFLNFNTNTIEHVLQGFT